MYAQFSKIWMMLTILTLSFMTINVTVAAEKSKAFEGATFTNEFITSPENIETGKVIWEEQCSACHGMRAYPGKAPKLKPAKYTIDFVYKRITKGFRGMPSWKAIYNEHERMSVASYVMSPGFRN